MKKVGVWVSLALAMPLLLVGGLLVFVFTLDPNDYRDEISNLAAERGIELQIRGNLDWKLFPQLVLGINDVQVSSQFGASQVEAQVQRIGLELRLMPLLQKRLEFRGLNISGADVVLRQQEAESQQSLSSEAQIDSSTSGLPSIFFEQLQLSDSRFALFSANSEPVVITDLSIDGQNINTSGSFFPLQASFAIQPIGFVEFAGPISLDTELSFSPEQLQLRLSSASLILRQPNADIPISAEGGLSLNLADQKIVSERLSLSLGVMQLDSEIQAQLNPLLIRASVRSNEFSPSSLLTLAGISFDMSDASALASAQIQFDLQASPDLVESTQLVLQIDDTELRGQLRAELSEIPALTITANLDQLDLERYLPAQAAAGEEPDSTTAAAHLPSHLGRYDLSVGELRMKNLSITNVQARISSSEKQIALEELRGELAGGNFSASSRLGLSLEDQAHRIALDANNIYIGQVLAAMSGGTAPITGQLSGTFSATSLGVPSDFLTNMRGGGSVNAGNLVLVDVDIEGRVCDISDRLQRQSLLSNYGEFAESTALNDMTALIEVGDGLAKLTRLDAGIGNIKASATGQMTLDSLQYSAAIKALIASEKTSETGCTVNRYLRNRTLPLTCSGSLNAGQPRCGIDQSFIQSAIQQAFTQGLANQLLGTGSAETGNENGEETEVESKPVQQQIIENIFNRLNR